MRCDQLQSAKVKVFLLDITISLRSLLWLFRTWIEPCLFPKSKSEFFSSLVVDTDMLIMYFILAQFHVQLYSVCVVMESFVMCASHFTKHILWAQPILQVDYNGKHYMADRGEAQNSTLLLCDLDDIYVNYAGINTMEL